MIDALASGKFRSIFETLVLANRTPDKQAFRKSILRCLSEGFRSDQVLFAIHKEDSDSLDFVLRNMDEKFNRMYLDYYFALDPFQVVSGQTDSLKLVPGPLSRKGVVRLEDLVDYPSYLFSEYYNDFLRPQKSFHEAVTYLRTGTEVLGFISLFRPKTQEAFSSEEVELLRILSNYLSVTMENINLRSKIELGNAVIEVIRKQSPHGLMIFDEGMRLIHMNSKAREYCKEMNGVSALSKEMLPSTSSILLQDCLALRDEVKKSSGRILILPKCRVVESKGRKYLLRSQLVENDMDLKVNRFFAVMIEEKNQLGSLSEDNIQLLFGLTRREAEIVTHIFRGLKNSEIAERLYISEITVKKHVQNVCEKLRVKNRTALIYEVLKGSNVISTDVDSIR